MSDKNETAKDQIARLTRERDAYKRAKDENDLRFMTERDEARQERDAAIAERDAAREEARKVALEAPSQTCRRIHVQMCNQCDAITCGDNVSEARALLDGERKKHAGEVAELQRALDLALVDHSALEAERARLAKENEGLRGERDEARKIAAEGRKAGRAEAAALLMQREAEDWDHDLLTSCSVGDTGDYETVWKSDEVLKAFDAEDSEMTSALDRSEGAYWSLLGETDEKIERLAKESDTLRAQLSTLAAEHESAARAAEKRIGKLTGALGRLESAGELDCLASVPCGQCDHCLAKAALAEVKP